MSIEQEIDELIVFLTHPAGFEISVGPGQLYLTPDNYNGNWCVKWYEFDGVETLDFSRTFTELKEAVKFFVERRHYICVGFDFDNIKQQEEELSDE